DPKFKAVADQAIKDVLSTSMINRIYEQWFLKPIPPKGVNLNIPMSGSLKKTVARPTDSPDPKDYQ
ncbi:MAG: hypothetical protein RIQ66_157, partial [Pseudomonadota bacterium]